jgi:hypothetical protein
MYCFFQTKTKLKRIWFKSRSKNIFITKNFYLASDAHPHFSIFFQSAGFPLQQPGMTLVSLAADAWSPFAQKLGQHDQAESSCQMFQVLFADQANILDLQEGLASLDLILK